MVRGKILTLEQLEEQRSGKRKVWEVNLRGEVRSKIISLERSRK